jgi:uncharacterized protein (DUF4415 family)
MTTTRKKKGKIQIGNVDLSSDEFHPKNVKVRVTMMVDEDIVSAFRTAAAKTGGRVGYQTMINDKLRETLPTLENLQAKEDRLMQALNKIEEMQKRLDQLEATLFKYMAAAQKKAS